LGGHNIFGEADTATITGGSLSLTVTVKEHDWPLEFETLTVVVPTEKKLPEAGVLVTEQGPEVVGAKFTTAPHLVGSLLTVMLDGQLRVHCG
jgi:hypothetical protein